MIDKNYVDVIETELANLSKITHPHILLLMGVTPSKEDENENLQLIFEYVQMGSLYFWLHKSGKDQCIQSTAEYVIQVR